MNNLPIINKVVKEIVTFDSNFEGYISTLYSRFAQISNPPLIVLLMPDFTKVIAYSLLILIPLLFFKLMRPYSRTLTLVIIAVIGTDGLMVFGVLMGFLQLLYL